MEEKNILIKNTNTLIKVWGAESSGKKDIIPEKKALLILHGWGSNSDRWAEVAEKILTQNPNLTIIAPDLPGFGKSDALEAPWNTNQYIEWIDELILHFKLKDFYLMGHSFGGALASKLAVKHVQDIDKLFLVSAACVRRKTAKKKTYAAISKIIKLFSFMPLYKFFRKAVYKFIIRRSDYTYVEGNLRQTYLNVIAEDLSFHLPFIKVPTTIIWGSKDNFTPIEDARFINKQIKNSKLIIIPEAGHDLNRKQPEILAQKVTENI
jgi:pimeloyl-ACP methyl ester carboxylesterase